MALQGVDQVDRGSTLAQDVYSSLRKAVMNGSVKPGEKVSARAVAESTGVSFTPAREAITRLIKEGALLAVSPKTTIVPHLDLDSLEEITQLRFALECMAAREAASKITPSELKRLQSLESDYERVRNAQSYAQSLSVNEEFHFTIYRASRLPKTIGFIEELWVQIGPSFNLLKSNSPMPQRPLKFHREAIAGLASADADRTESAIKADLQFGYERLKLMITQRDMPS